MIRVGFILSLDNGWLGGVNYFRNLFVAIQSLSDTKIHPVIFTGLKSNVIAFEGIAEIVRTPILDSKSFPWLMSGFLRGIFPRRDYLLYWILKKHCIDIVSHIGVLWRGCPIPSIYWIPDFQHIHLPSLFTEQDVAGRNIGFTNLIHRSNAILLSSENALNDLRSFCPQYTKSVYVLHFVSCLQDNRSSEISKSDIQKRYSLSGTWFHVPNQFWEHKNHGIIIKALHLLKQQGKSLLVVATGNTNDSRNSDYFPLLMNQVSEYGLQENFRVLGILPYADVLALMRYSVAIINPSLFEGWSTSVEESKAMGKKILLSDIAVHREQNPVRGCYFDTNIPDSLANQMVISIQEYDELEDAIHQNKAQVEQIVNMQNFAKQYEMIIYQVIGRYNSEKE